jgi:leucyl-tRNA synthetase
MGMLRFDEPFTKLFNQGMLHGTDGNKMSKSLGNVINPIESSEKYGADSLRLALMSFASPDKDTNWDENVLMGSFKFIDKIFNYFNCVKISKKTDAKTESKLNKTIKEVGLDIEDFKYNLAIIKIRGLFEALPGEINKEVLEKFLKLLHPFCPHITEEFWEKLGNKGFVSLSDWPKAGKIDERLLKQDKMIEDLIKDINNILKILAVRGEKKAIVKVFAIPNEVDVYSKEKEQIKKRVNLDVKLFSIKEAISEGKTVKAKPGKPGILIE